jgi:multiple sugar transport system substrate-binding protein
MEATTSPGARITRRQLLEWSSLAGMSALLAACAPEVVKEAVEVEKEVTRVVQQVVTPTPGPRQKVRMTWTVHWGGAYGQMNEEIAQMYMDRNPHVEIETMPGHGVSEVQMMIAGGTPPEIAHQFWLWLRLFITQDALLDLSAYVENAKGSTRANFSQGYWDMCDSRGKPFAVPYLQAGVRHAMFWNKSLFEKAGLDPEKPPKTPSELLTVGERLTEFDSAGQVEVLGYNPTDYGPLNYWGKALGVEWYDPVRRQVHYNQPAFLDFLTSRAEFIRKIGWDKLAAWKDALSQAKQDAFVFEKQAIVTSHGDWYVSGIRSGNPELEGRYSVTYIPSTVGKKTILGYTHTLCIPKGSREKDAAWEFIDWACGSDEVCEKSYQDSGSVAPWLPWRARQDWDAPDKLPFTGWFIRTLQEADYAGPEDYPDLVGMLGREPELRIRSAEEAIWAGQLSPAEALQRLDRELQPLIDQAIKQYNL